MIKRMDQNGLTLVELMVALVLGFIVIGVMYSAYRAQEMSSVTQTIVAETQQNLRSGMDILTRELRMAGYDPSGTGKYGITAASVGSISFTADLCEDGGDPDSCTQEGTESFVYEVYTTADDKYADGSLIPKLRRTSNGSAIASGIEQLEFQYLDKNGNVLSVPVDSLNLKKISQVQVSMLVRAPRSSRDYTNTNIYTTYSGTVWDPDPDDNYRRRFVRKTILLRNMGL